MKVALKKLVEIKSGYSPSTFELMESGSIPYVKVEDMNNCTKYQSESREYCEDTNRSIPSGAIIFPKRGAAIMNNKVRITATDICMDTNMMAIIPNGKIQSEFLYYTITHAKLSRIADTSTIPQINNKHINPYKIPLPPLPEQKAIAALLSTWDEAIEKTERLIQAKERRFRWLLRKLMTPATVSSDECSVMSDELENNSDLSTHNSKLTQDAHAKWKKMKLGEIGEIKKGKGITKSDLCEKGYPCIRYAEIYTDYHYHTNFIKSTVTKEASDSAFKLKTGDVLFAASGETQEEIGKCVAYLGDGKACTGGDTLILRTNPKSFNPMFLGFALNNPDVNKQKSAYAHGNSVVHLYGKDLSKIIVLVPPLEDQKAIAEALTASRQEIDLLKQLADKYKTQKRGLMQKMLTGIWRVAPDAVMRYE